MCGPGVFVVPIISVIFSHCMFGQLENYFVRTETVLVKTPLSAIVANLSRGSFAGRVIRPLQAVPDWSTPPLRGLRLA